jgi:hypothetical protein
MRFVESRLVNACIVSNRVAQFWEKILWPGQKPMAQEWVVEGVTMQGTYVPRSPLLAGEIVADGCVHRENFGLYIGKRFAAFEHDDEFFVIIRG